MHRSKLAGFIIDCEGTDPRAAAAFWSAALGARRIGPVQGWVVMEAPTGQRFCVVGPCTPGFEAEATRWP